MEKSVDIYFLWSRSYLRILSLVVQRIQFYLDLGNNKSEEFTLFLLTKILKEDKINHVKGFSQSWGCHYKGPTLFFSNQCQNLFSSTTFAQIRKVRAEAPLFIPSALSRSIGNILIYVEAECIKLLAANLLHLWPFNPSP